MAYTRPMRINSCFSHALVASLPLMALLALLFAVFGTEQEMLMTFRLDKADNFFRKEAMFLVTDWGNPAMYIAYLAILYRGVTQGDKNLTRFCLVYVGVQLLICFALVGIVKATLGRPRPDNNDIFWRPLTLSPYYHSLPSGHTAEITGSCLALACFLKRYPVTILLGCFLALVAFSRIYLNMHYPSDVLFGWMFGAVSASLIISFGLPAKDTTLNE